MEDSRLDNMHTILERDENLQITFALTELALYDDNNLLYINSEYSVKSELFEYIMMSCYGKWNGFNDLRLQQILISMINPSI